MSSDDLKRAIHAAARRYCIEHSAEWGRVYSQRPRDQESEWSQGIFPRYLVLDAILAEVERFTLEQFKSLDEARDLLARAGETAEDMMTRPPHSTIAMNATNEERRLFVEYVRNVSTEALFAIEPLPFRRTLSEGEETTSWRGLSDRWEVDRQDHWYPISAHTPPSTMAFNWRSFDAEVDKNAFRDIFRRQGLNTVFELREYGPSYEIAVDILEPQYTGAEGFWTAGGADWVVYASHEGSITFASEWLIDELKQLWPLWSESIYTGWETA